MIYIAFIVISIISVLVSIRLAFFFRDIRNITDALEELNNDESRKRLTTSSGNKHIESLCESINKSIAIQEQSQVNMKNYERRLRDSIANTSHDLRTPLTAILGYISMIKMKPEKVSDYLGIIECKANLLHRLVEEFYELSVLDDERYEVQFVKFDFVALVTNCVLEYYPLFQKKGIVLDASLPEKAILINSGILETERILQNLMQNATKFSSKYVRIQITEDEDKCEFTIENDTETLTSEDVTRLFDRFYIADKSRSEGNTGLGLYIVKLLLEKTHGELINVSLKEGCFSIGITFNKTLR